MVFILKFRGISDSPRNSFHGVRAGSAIKDRVSAPVMYIDGNELKREQYLKYLGITFDRSLCGNEHVTRTRLALSFKRMYVAKFQTKVRMIVMRYLITH